MQIYFIQGSLSDAIKIGKAKNPMKRLASLRTGYPGELKILATLPEGTYNLTESGLHDQFRDARVNGEWYRPVPELLELIRQSSSTISRQELVGTVLRSAPDFGSIVRRRRQELGKRQQEVAEKAKVSRKWLVDLERGKGSAEIGLVLRVLTCLGIRLSVADLVTPPEVNLIDAVIDNLRPGV